MPIGGPIRALARDLAYRHVGGTALVLAYHRVADLERDPQLLAVTPERFDAQMAVLAKSHPVVSVSELAEGVRERRVPRGAVAVTFDDGYADSLSAAAPALARHGIPATFFVSSGFTGGAHEFWWDELERLVLAPGTLPRSIHLEDGDVEFSFEIGDGAEYGEAQAAAHASWTVLDPPEHPRHALYSGLCELIRPLPVAQRDAIIGQLRQLAVSDTGARATHRQLDDAEIAALDRTPGLRVGGHTCSHVRLSALPMESQHAEVTEDRASLERICGHPIGSFSYPFGGPDDYTAETVDVVRDAGYANACANHPGVVKPWSDAYRLPRVLVRDLEAPAFSALLEGWFRDPR